MSAADAYRYLFIPAVYALFMFNSISDEFLLRGGLRTATTTTTTVRGNTRLAGVRPFKNRETIAFLMFYDRPGIQDQELLKTTARKFHLRYVNVWLFPFGVSVPETLP
jgi:hypothetical protein